MTSAFLIGCPLFTSKTVLSKFSERISLSICSLGWVTLSDVDLEEWRNRHPSCGRSSERVPLLPMKSPGGHKSVLMLHLGPLRNSSIFNALKRGQSDKLWTSPTQTVADPERSYSPIWKIVRVPSAADVCLDSTERVYRTG